MAEPPDAFTFRRSLLRDVVYGLLTHEAAAVLHERAAAHLAEAGGSTAAIAGQLDRALRLREELGAGVDPDLVERTTDALTRLGETQLERGDGPAAGETVQRIVEVRRSAPAWSDVDVRRRAVDIAYRLGAWERVLELAGEDPADPPTAKAVGVALTRKREDPEALARGRSLLERAIATGHDPDAAASLAGSWKGLDDDLAQQLYLRAHELDPADPYALGNLLEYEIETSEDLAPVEVRRSAIEAAAERCADDGAVGRNIPWAWFDLGKLRLLLGDRNGALTAYATAIGRSVAAFQLSTSAASLDRLAPHARSLDGLEEARRLLALGGAARFGGDGDRASDLATPEASPLRSPIAILAGGSSDAVDERIRGYGGVLRAAFAGWSGTLISGGTRQGVSAIAGDLGSDGMRVVGYLPAATSGVAIDEDPARYAELRRTDGEGFSEREPIRYWADIVASRVDPGSVRVIALAGGSISAFEYRLAVALGARVGVVHGSGDAATDFLRRSSWSASGRVEELEPEPDAIRTFLDA